VVPDNDAVEVDPIVIASVLGVPLPHVFDGVTVHVPSMALAV
jgi:hypothetical protein